jgi:hypothetical protein
MNQAIVALDARSGKVLARAAMGSVHWQSPIVIEGSVYCADQDGNLNAYGPP